ncbi:MAG TPA: hypothetical protein VGL86_21740 [Polyangia bacterium]|jgi:hypothetical protein
MSRAALALGVVLALGGCGDGGAATADLASPSGARDGGDDLGVVAADGGDDGGAAGACEWGGAPGTCLTLSACAAMAGHSSEAGSCPGPATIECCIVTPSVADNPPVPSGYMLMAQAQVTPAMTNWAVMILDAPTVYPMFAAAMMTFGAQPVLARVEWHPPDFQNSVVHRGVTLYVPS